jgi:outer membrane protein insertion porin family
LLAVCLSPLFANVAAQAQPATPPSNNRPARPTRAARPASHSPASHSAASHSPASRERARVATHPGDTIADVKVVGASRIEDGTIKSYMLVGPGDPFDPDRIDRSLKTLYATGLFSDVSLKRDGNTLVVTVTENPTINSVTFEGNHKIDDKTLTPLIDERPRGVYSPQVAQADRQKILDAYAKRGRFGATVEPKIIRLEQNRVDVVFEINEGTSTLVSRIAFVGNHKFSESRLREVINTREEAFYRILSSSDSYDPERVTYDRELLRRFYLKNGYADFEVKNVTAELAPDRSAFFLTFTLSEGDQYKVGAVSIDNKLPKLDGNELLPLIDLQVGDIYDGDSVERSVTALETAVQNRGYAFVQVRPRIARNREKHTVDLVFDIGEGPRVYVERIDIEGNTRTKDKVIRRELRFAEGDAFNAGNVRISRTRLQDLGYFNTVNITTQPGSTADKTVVTTHVDEKATGELTFGGGYSTDAGALLNVGVHERNLIGSGLDAGINGVLAQLRSEINFSLTDPYFLDRNLVAGIDIFHVENNNQSIADYDERRTGFTLRAGYEINEHLRQALAYSLVDRNVYNIAEGSSLFVEQQQGESLLSQIGQTLTLDYRDSRSDPHTGFIVRYGLDYAGLGGTAHYVRNKVDGTYFIPLDYFSGNTDWGIRVSGGAGLLTEINGHVESIVDRFYLGGDNLRGFANGGAGPHSLPFNQGGIFYGADSVGGRFIYTQSTELHFPLPISADLGLSGRAFFDLGGLSVVGQLPPTQSTNILGQPQTVTQQRNDYASIRAGTGVGVSWKTPFGLINIDLAVPVMKRQYDQTQFFRFGFGTRF